MSIVKQKISCQKYQIKLLIKEKTQKWDYTHTHTHTHTHTDTHVNTQHTHTQTKTNNDMTQYIVKETGDERNQEI